MDIGGSTYVMFTVHSLIFTNSHRSKNKNAQFDKYSNSKGQNNYSDLDQRFNMLTL